jgi:hypothetical protein
MVYYMDPPDDFSSHSENIYHAPKDFYGNFYGFDMMRVQAEEEEAIRNNPNAGLPVGSYMPHEIERIREELKSMRTH